jgi:hypothetical protein
VQKRVPVIVAAILAVLLAFLLLGVSYILFPNQTSQPIIPTPIPKPEPLLNQALWTIQWLGVAALIALSAVGALLLISRMKNR